MTERRRFFPSTPVQQIPGARVELEMQLQPLAPETEPEPPPCCPCDVMGAGWLTSLTSANDAAPWQPPENGAGWSRPAGNSPAWTQGQSTWQAEPDTFNDNGAPLESPGLRCTYLEIPLGGVMPPVIIGVLQGSNLCKARWQLAWNNPDPQAPSQCAAGHRAISAGNMVYVYLKTPAPALPPTDLPPGPQIPVPIPAPDILTATAYCNDNQAARLTLVITEQAAAPPIVHPFG
ncbi:MAG: hypothetical protein FWG56_07915 [Desulfovibrionaceae bacterium]|nr:hypothetical protein [Desulfovibrionaceae bacterium]